MPIKTQDAWIEELARLIRPSGRVVLSFRPGTTRAVDVQSDPGISREWLGLDGAPLTYFKTTHNLSALGTYWDEHFELVDLWPQAIRNQALALFRPQSVQG